jgi:hypothetical protein
LEKSAQKTSAMLGHGRWCIQCPWPSGAEVFLLVFLQKKQRLLYPLEPDDFRSNREAIRSKV